MTAGSRFNTERNAGANNTDAIAASLEPYAANAFDRAALPFASLDLIGALAAAANTSELAALDGAWYEGYSSPNGIPDAAEFYLLEYALKHADVDCSATGGTTHAAAAMRWQDVREQLAPNGSQSQGTRKRDIAIPYRASGVDSGRVRCREMKRMLRLVLGKKERGGGDGANRKTLSLNQRITHSSRACGH